MLHMEDVWRVLRPKVMGHIREKPRRFIAGRLHALTVQTRKRLGHEGMPRVLLTGWGRLLQEDIVALGLQGHEAQPPGRPGAAPQRRPRQSDPGRCVARGGTPAACHRPRLRYTPGVSQAPDEARR